MVLIFNEIYGCMPKLYRFFLLDIPFQVKMHYLLSKLQAVTMLGKIAEDCNYTSATNW